MSDDQIINFTRWELRYRELRALIQEVGADGELDPTIKTLFIGKANQLEARLLWSLGENVKAALVVTYDQHTEDPNKYRASVLTLNREKLHALDAAVKRETTTEYPHG